MPLLPRKVVKSVPTAKKVQKPLFKLAPPLQPPKQERLVVKTQYERPVLRAFESMVHLELAIEQLKKVGVFVLNEEDKTFNLHSKILSECNELLQVYKSYWKGVDVQ